MGGKAWIFFAIALLFFGRCRTDKDETTFKNLEITVDGQEVMLYEMSSTNSSNQQDTLMVDNPNKVLIKLTGGYDDIQDKLDLVVNDKKLKFYGPEKLLVNPVWEDNRILISICFEKDCLSAVLIHSVGEDEEEEEEEEEDSESFSDSKVKDEPEPVKGKRSNNEEPNAQSNSDSQIAIDTIDEKMDSINESDLISDDVEFQNFESVGYQVSKDQCDPKTWVEGFAEIELLPKVNIELVSFGVISNKTGKVVVSLENEDEVILDPIEKVVIKDQLSEINFQHQRLILYEGVSYNVKVQSNSADSINFETFKECNPSIPDSEKLTLNPKINGNIFSQFNYQW